MIFELPILLILAYILGSIPFGVLIARANGVDIMKVGSGNIGATNVMRVLGKGPAFLVFFLDTLKGAVPALAARYLFPERQELWLLAGAMAVVGHSFSPFLKFKGGKGIASALGMVIGASPIIALSAFIVFSLTLATTGFMSLASMVAVASTVPVGLLLKESYWMIAGYVVLSSLIIWRHRANIERLRKGTEPKFLFKKTVKPSEEAPEDEVDSTEQKEEEPTDAP
jgi:glycerol-3-phosphate acyltransferase PlsY